MVVFDNRKEAENSASCFLSLAVGSGSCAAPADAELPAFRRGVLLIGTDMRSSFRELEFALVVPRGDPAAALKFHDGA